MVRDGGTVRRHIHCCRPPAVLPAWPPSIPNRALHAGKFRANPDNTFSVRAAPASFTAGGGWQAPDPRHPCQYASQSPACSLPGEALPDLPPPL